MHIIHGCFTGTGAIIQLPEGQWSYPAGYGYNRWAPNHNNTQQSMIVYIIGMNHIRFILWYSFKYINCHRLEVMWYRDMGKRARISIYYCHVSTKVFTKHQTKNSNAMIKPYDFMTRKNITIIYSTVLTIVANDVLELNHQAISIQSGDRIISILDKFHTKILHSRPIGCTYQV